MSTSGSLTATRGSFGSLSVDSGGRTGGSYHGGLSGCGGSLGTGIKIGSTPIGTYVENLIANTVTANYVNTKIASMSSVGISTLNVSSRLNVNGTFYVGGTVVRKRTLKDGDGTSHTYLTLG